MSPHKNAGARPGLYSSISLSVSPRARKDSSRSFELRPNGGRCSTLLEGDLRVVRQGKEKSRN
jgi:hypothetical protein